MVSLDRFDTFKAVVEAGSLTAAADLLGQTRAVVSFNLKRLEAELGVTLLTRNTRQLALTDAGERFYVRCTRMLEEARLAVEEARSEHAQLKGTLRITTTVEYALAVVAPAIEAFRRLHPDLNIHLSTSSTHADLISERFDVAIRLGRLLDSNHRAVQLSSFDVFAVAAPSLGGVSTLDELEQLPKLGHGRLTELRGTDPQGGTSLSPRPRVTGRRQRSRAPGLRRARTWRGSVAAMAGEGRSGGREAGALVAGPSFCPARGLRDVSGHSAFAPEGAGVY